MRLAHDIDYVEDKLKEKIANKKRDLDFQHKAIAHRARALAARFMKHTGGPLRRELSRKPTMSQRLEEHHQENDQQMLLMNDNLEDKHIVLSHAVSVVLPNPRCGVSCRGKAGRRCK